MCLVDINYWKSQCSDLNESENFIFETVKNFIQISKSQFWEIYKSITKHFWKFLRLTSLSTSLYLFHHLTSYCTILSIICVFLCISMYICIHVYLLVIIITSSLKLAKRSFLSWNRISICKHECELLRLETDANTDDDAHSY